MVVILLLLLSGDIETNPGPGGEYSLTLNFTCCMVERNWNEAKLANSIPGNKLTLDDLGCVLEEILDLTAQWYHLGLQLKVKAGTLDRIRAQFSDPKDLLMEMLKTWLTTSDNTTWKTHKCSQESKCWGKSASW